MEQCMSADSTGL